MKYKLDYTTDKLNTIIFFAEHAELLYNSEIGKYLQITDKDKKVTLPMPDATMLFEWYKEKGMWITPMPPHKPRIHKPVSRQWWEYGGA